MSGTHHSLNPFLDYIRSPSFWATQLLKKNRENTKYPESQEMDSINTEEKQLWPQAKENQKLSDLRKCQEQFSPKSFRETIDIQGCGH